MDFLNLDLLRFEIIERLEYAKYTKLNYTAKVNTFKKPEMLGNGAFRGKEIIDAKDSYYIGGSGNL